MSVANVQDVAEIFAQAVIQPEKSKGEVFNAISWPAFTHAQYLSSIAEVLEIEPVVEYVDTEEVLARRTESPMFHEGDYRFFMSDLSVSGAKSEKLLGVKSRATLNQVLRESLEGVVL